MNGDLQTQLVKELVVESLEGLDEFDRELLLLEKGEATDETPHAVFRVIHSLKGTSGCLGLSRIEALAHAGENLLSLLREGKIATTPELISVLFAFSDTLRGALQRLGAEGVEHPEDHSDLLRDLHALANATSHESQSEMGLFSDEPEPPRQLDPRASGIESNEREPSKLQKPTATGGTVASAGEGAIRVDVEQLDNLMDLVGELVLARNQILQFAGQLRESSLAGTAQRLNAITTKLQENVMKTRMQPIGNVWSKFPRIVRDLSHELGKKVGFQMEGSETELDRTIIEAIKDPLTHLVRNAVDHGIEAPDVRLAAGKREEGMVRLRAFHEGGQVNIEILDDGGGIDRERVVRKAVQKGLIQPEQGTRMSDQEILLLLFSPGFSTADKVTTISGRGVGMDVVKKNVEKIGGVVSLQSEAGRSTIVRIKIPLTLAIIPALIVRCCGERYAIPQASLIELVRVDAERRKEAVESIAGVPVYRLRGNLLPLVHLREQLGLEPAEDSGTVFLLVLQAEGRQFGVVVDAISDTEEIVVKPLGKELKGLSVYAGATIMGDGRVALILDVIGIARMANLLRQSVTDAIQSHQGSTTTGQRQSLLLFSLGDGRRAALPLAHVARLEELPAASVEMAGSSKVIQYRGKIMPIIDVGDVLGFPPATPDEKIRLIVYAHDGANVGLVVDRILDTVEEVVSIQRCTNRPGLLGSAIVQKKVTDFIDVEGLLEISGVVRLEVAA